MDVKEILPTGNFSKAQLDLLKMFSTEVPEKDWEAIREYAKHYFANKATTEMDKLFEEQGWDEEKINEWANKHLRTPYTK